MSLFGSVRHERIFFDTKIAGEESKILARHVAKRMKRRIAKSTSASAPGQAPKSKRGVLRRSIGTKRLRAPAIGYFVGPRERGPASRDGFHGRFLEHGTAKMDARPFVEKTIDTERSFIEHRLAEAARSSVRVEK